MKMNYLISQDFYDGSIMAQIVKNKDYKYGHTVRVTAFLSKDNIIVSNKIT